MASAPSRIVPLALAAFGVAMSFSAAPAKAAGVMDSFMNLLGLKQEEEQQIEYRDRAPLVVPPKMQLPPPQVSAAERSAAWPKDPDAEYRKAVENDKKTPVGLRPDRSAPNGRVPVANATRKTGGGGAAGPTVVDNYTPNRPSDRSIVGGEGGWVHPDKMQSFKNPQAEQTTTLAAGQEPTRNYLTDPPQGLRVPAGNASIAMPKKSLAKPAFIQEQEERDPLTPYRKQGQPQNDD
ncbi:hypothetical protein NK718_11745 [Alsobacter sp. SYSU M60028]|uniref:Uncharacterized protein n=1 Tax=Alsobacter ponti TaxID=2962936 RepID=A0ABT1LDL0_9HYPH|nr:hypothetical protein [Alsobacter ponti]MCP8939191.1 hypothetical protein [Alsobacter ponti]